MRRWPGTGGDEAASCRVRARPAFDEWLSHCHDFVVSCAVLLVSLSRRGDIYIIPRRDIAVNKMQRNSRNLLIFRRSLYGDDGAVHIWTAWMITVCPVLFLSKRAAITRILVQNNTAYLVPKWTYINKIPFERRILSFKKERFCDWRRALSFHPSNLAI